MKETRMRDGEKSLHVSEKRLWRGKVPWWGGVPGEGGQERTPGRGEVEYLGHDSKNVIPPK